MSILCPCLTLVSLRPADEPFDDDSNDSIDEVDELVEIDDAASSSPTRFEQILASSKPSS